MSRKIFALGSVLAATLFLTACPMPGVLSPEGPSESPGKTSGRDKDTTTSSPTKVSRNPTALGGLDRSHRAGTAFDTGNLDNSARGGRTLFAVYMLGSDLEGENGFGTGDLNEMLQGYQNLSGAEREDLDVVVGFGGANKPGWQGIKYTDINCLSQDGADGTYGNASCYLGADGNANMGSPQTLSEFVAFLKNNYPADNYGKTMIILWNHGGAHTGYGPDSNFGNDGFMELTGINQALRAYSEKFDLVGFDACLMGNLTVARHVKDSGHFLLGSEELEPGHGWQYADVLTFIGQNAEASVVEMGKHMVDSFITHPDHADQGGKTLSLVNLDQFDRVAAELDQLGQSLRGSMSQNYQAVLTSASKAQAYGQNSRQPTGLAIDSLHFVNILKEEQPGLALSGLEAALQDYVMYSRDDGTRPDSLGVAFYPPHNLAHFNSSHYRAEVAESSGWFGFVEQFLTTGATDVSEPVIEPAPVDTVQTETFDEPDAVFLEDYTQTFEGVENTEYPGAEGTEQEYSGDEYSEDEYPEDEYSEDEYPEDEYPEDEYDTPASEDVCADGQCWQIQDDRGLLKTLAIRAIISPDGKTAEIVNGIPASEIAPGIFRDPGWDGSALYLCGTSECSADNRSPVPLLFEDVTDAGSALFVTDGQLNGEEVVFYLEIDKTGNVLDVWAVPFETNEDGEFLRVSKEQLNIEIGDEVAFYLQEVDLESEEDEENYVLSVPIIASEAAQFYYLKPEGTLFTFLLAEDLKGNLQFSDPQLLE